MLVFPEHNGPPLVKNLVGVQLPFTLLFIDVILLDPRSSAVGGRKNGKRATIPTPVSDLWTDPVHSAIPSDVYCWRTAFQDVDKDPKRVRANAPKLAYFFPHPALFVNGDSKERRERYLRNWLASRSAWVTRLSIADPSPVAPRHWRDFLNTIPATITSTHSGIKLRESANLFGPEFVGVTQGTTSEVQFRDITLNFAAIGQIDDFTKGKILWDLYEHNFRFEFLALDRLLAPQVWSNPNNSRFDEVREVSLLFFQPMW